MITHEDQPFNVESSSPGSAAFSDSAADRPAQASFAPGMIGEVGVPLIGRDAELQQLLELFYGVAEEGGTRLVTVVGESGIGKSRLLFEFRHLVARLPEPIQFHTFQADRQLTSQPYSLVRQLVDTLFRIRPGDQPATVQTRIERGVSLLLGPNQLEKAHFVGYLAGYDFSASPHLRGVLHDARQIRDRGLHYAIQCIAALTARTPMVLVVDDFHEADDSSIDAFEHVAREGRGLNLLIICLAQPGLLQRRPAWAERAPAARSIALPPLDERDSRRLVAEFLRKAGKLPHDLRNLIVGRSEGNPFYIEELIKMLIADGAIVPGEHSWQIQVGRLSRLRVPSTLDDLLRARLQALAPQEREFLVRAAVVGRAFWLSAVLRMTGIDMAVGEAAATRPLGLASLLATLERHELIVAQASSRFAGEQEYLFKHQLLHEVAYQQNSPEQLQQLHLHVAEWLIERGSERADSYAGLIAEHFERAEDRRAAASWYLRAGLYAKDTHAVDAALKYFRSALASLPETPGAELITCYEGLGEAQAAATRFGDAISCFARMRDLAAACDPIAEARAWNHLAFIYDIQVEPRLAHDAARRAIELAEIAGDTMQLALGLVRLAWAELRLDNPTLALELGERALALATDSGDKQIRARSRGVIGVAYEHLGAYEPAARFLEEALQINYELGDLSQVTIHLNNLGHLANDRGDFAAARRFLEEDLRICREIGSRVGEIFALSNLGATLNGLGAYAEAEAEIRHGIHLSETRRLVVFSDFYRDLAIACLGQGRVDEAIEAAQQALDLARKAENPREIGAAWRALGQAIGSLSDPQGAPPCFAESVRLLEETQATTERARTLREWARHELRHGSPEQGARLWAEARAIFAQMGLEHELALTPETPPARQGLSNVALWRPE